MRQPMARFSALFALALPLAAGCTIADQVRSRDLIREGNAAYRDGQYEKAIEHYGASLELEPDGVTVRWNRACAAESLVLNLKEATEPKQVEARRKFADMALADFQAWLDGLEVRDEEQAKTVESHRLALMRADVRCDDLVSHYLKQHRENPQDESQYTRIARIQEDVCGRVDEATNWFEKRVRDFPKSEKAWYALAVRKFTPLIPDGTTGLPFNDQIRHGPRQTHGDRLSRPLHLRSMAYAQRQFACKTRRAPSLHRLQALLAREDSMLAWKEQKALCQLNNTPACPVEIDFAQAAKTPAIFEGQRVVLMGEVVGGSVARDGASTQDLSIYSLSLTTQAPKPEEGEAPAPAEEGAPPQLVRVKYSFEFVPPKPEEGAEPAEGEDPVADARKDFDERTAETVEGFKPGKLLMLTGTFKGGVFETKEEPPAACCPAPPIG